jgi:hypothetical protein
VLKNQGFVLALQQINMARRRAKKTVKKSPPSLVNDVNGSVEKEAQIDKEQAAFADQEGIFSFLFFNIYIYIFFFLIQVIHGRNGRIISQFAIFFVSEFDF